MSKEDRACDYNIPAEWARELLGVAMLPADLRRRALELFAKSHGSGALLELFAEFIGLANSVVANNREMIELLGIIEGGAHPNTVEKYNLPTIFGALNGAVIAAGLDTSKMCAGCAFRPGTPANQSSSTTCDAEWATKGDGRQGTIFMCHEDVDEKGEPKHACAGYAQAKKRGPSGADYRTRIGVVIEGGHR